MNGIIQFFDMPSIGWPLKWAIPAFRRNLALLPLLIDFWMKLVRQSPSQGGPASISIGHLEHGKIFPPPLSNGRGNRSGKKGPKLEWK